MDGQTRVSVDVNICCSGNDNVKAPHGLRGQSASISSVLRPEYMGADRKATDLHLGDAIHDGIVAIAACRTVHKESYGPSGRPRRNNICRESQIRAERKLHARNGKCHGS